MALTKVQNTGIADDAITTDKIENTTVVAADIADGTVSADKLASTLDLSSKTVTLKNSEISNAELANSSITLNGSSISLGGSGTAKHIDWQALTVADGSTQLTAVAGRGYFLDTNTGVIEVLLPSSPSRGDTFVFADYGGTFATNQLIINTGGQLIDSTAGPDFKVTTNNAVVELVYVDANKGYLVKLNQAAGSTPSSVLTDGLYDSDADFITATGGTITTVSTNYKVHTFTGDGNFVVSAGQGNLALVSYLVVAGGGAGSHNSGGGGGAGGYREGKVNTPALPDSYTASPLAATTGIQISPGTYPITVGAGATGNGPGNPGPATAGSNSVFSTITSAGGGFGGQDDNYAGGDGGSGGGGGGRGGPTLQAGGIGNTPPVSPPQGNNGGNGVTNSPARGQGGGGGAGQAGSNSPGARAGGPGGNGTPTNITGSDVTRAGGGGGGGGNGTPRPPNATGGTGGAGNGGQSAPSGGAGGNATANTGSGGGGGGDGSPAGGNGGKGVVVIRYKFQ